MKKRSFRKFEHMILPRFRQKINEAESTEDIQKMFTLSIMNMFEKAFNGRLPLEYGDVRLEPHKHPHFSVSRRLLKDRNIRSIWGDSDILQILEGLAESAAHRHKHLEKHPEKTDAKIRMGVFR